MKESLSKNLKTTPFPGQGKEAERSETGKGREFITPFVAKRKIQSISIPSEFKIWDFESTFPFQGKELLLPLEGSRKYARDYEQR
ncbi:hypothetical protein [Maribacter sp. 4G9]|uniref:hypothetical protein n=1 Tax=Maribacter sp. 4G9 TaxID=1889777 RepID=UPI000C15BEBE|nr:hypothetical protein [Maribacter sp. 4G9]PIB37908.1 hypothetical protein BFP75_19185 [Maribacter sp. 4G9]